jgi:hypothetical protein
MFDTSPKLPVAPTGMPFWLGTGRRGFGDRLVSHRQGDLGQVGGGGLLRWTDAHTRHCGGHECEEDLDLLGALLHVADVVEDQEVEGVEAGEGARQGQVALGGEQLLHEAEGGGEEHGVSSLHQGVAEGGGRVGLAAAGKAEAEDVDVPPDKYDALLVAPSKGRFFNMGARAAFTFRRVV